MNPEDFETAFDEMEALMSDFIILRDLNFSHSMSMVLNFYISRAEMAGISEQRFCEVFEKMRENFRLMREARTGSATPDR
jgi:hypothetical protein